MSRVHRTVQSRRQPRPLTPVSQEAWLHWHLSPAQPSNRRGPHLRQHTDHTRLTAQSLTVRMRTSQCKHHKHLPFASAYVSTTQRPPSATNESPTSTHQNRRPRNRRERIPWQNPQLPILLGTPPFFTLLVLITTTETYACATGRKRNPGDKVS